VRTSARRSFGKAAAAEPETRVEKLHADALVRADGDAHVLGIAARHVAEVRDFVHERDLRREHGVGRVLHDLRALRAHALDTIALAIERGVEAREKLVGAVVLRSDDDAIGLQEIVDGVALFQELGIGNDRDLELRVLLHDLAHAIVRSDGDRTLQDEADVVVSRF
jgi:hypothetical protein